MSVNTLPQEITPVTDSWWTSSVRWRIATRRFPEVVFYRDHRARTRRPL